MIGHNHATGPVLSHTTVTETDSLSLLTQKTYMSASPERDSLHGGTDIIFIHSMKVMRHTGWWPVKLQMPPSLLSTKRSKDVYDGEFLPL